MVPQEFLMLGHDRALVADGDPTSLARKGTE
jgi:hypothetical protein